MHNNRNTIEPPRRRERQDQGGELEKKAYMNSRIDFVRAGNNLVENLNSFVLEAYIDNKAVGEVFCANNEWRIRIASLEGVVDIRWVDFLKIVHEFSVFVIGESETLLNQKSTNADEDT